MKKIAIFLSAIAVIGGVLLCTKSCKSDKPKEEVPFAESFTANDYARVLPDEPLMLYGIHVFPVLEKTGFLTDVEFAGDRASLLNAVPERLRDGVSALMENPALSGLDTEKPTLFSICLAKDADGEWEGEDVYGAVPVKDHDALVALLDEWFQDDSPLTGDKDGILYYISSFGVALDKDVLAVYTPYEYSLPEKEIRAKLDKALAKKEFQASRPGVKDFFDSTSDMKSWSDLDQTWGIYDRAFDELLKNKKMSFATLIDGKPFEWMTVNGYADFMNGRIIGWYNTTGTNPLNERICSWVRKPNAALLDKLPANASVAGIFALQNLSDLLDYAQGILDRSGEADGMNLTDALSSVGFTPKDLDGIGTIAFGLELTEGGSIGDAVAVVEMEPQLLAKIRNLPVMAFLSHSKIDGADIYSVMNGLTLVLTDDCLEVVTVSPAQLRMQGLPKGGFRSNPMAARIADGGFASKGSLKALVRYLGDDVDESIMILPFAEAVEGFDINFTSNDANLYFIDKDVNAAHSLVRVVSRFLNSTGELDEDWDEDFDEGWDDLF